MGPEAGSENLPMQAVFRKRKRATESQPRLFHSCRMIANLISSSFLFTASDDAFLVNFFIYRKRFTFDIAKAEVTYRVSAISRQ